MGHHTRARICGSLKTRTRVSAAGAIRHTQGNVRVARSDLSRGGDGGGGGGGPRAGLDPREPPAPDYGIDLYVEAADDGRPNGRMLAMQIKGGASFFTETTDDGWSFAASSATWTTGWYTASRSSVVLYDPDDQMIVWQAVTAETAESPAKAGSC